jgi:hypothetical protein
LAAAVGMSILWDCPDPAGFEAQLAMLPQADIDLLGQVLAQSKAGDDPHDIAVAYERKATIDQLLRAREWVRQMPDHLRFWLRSFVEANDE